MKNKLRLLTSATILLGGVAAAYLLAEPAIKRWRAAAQQAEAPNPENQAQSSLERVLAANVAVHPSGDRQLLMAIARLEQRQTVAARIQHQANVAGLRLDGRGEYLQKDRGTRRQVRWLLETQREGVRASLLQATDGRFFWTDRHIATGRRIERVDLWQLRRISKRISEDSADSNLATSAPFSPQATTSFGGLPMLLESLRMHFEFTAPGIFRAPEDLNLDGQPVLGMIGRWRPEALAAVLADLSETEHLDLTTALLNAKLEERLTNGSLPAHIPISVLVLLGQQDLFPYLIEYRSADDSLAAASRTTESLFQLSRQPLARLQFMDVTFDREISTVEFIYEPPMQPDWFDGTSHYVDRMARRHAVQVAQLQAGRIATNRDAAPR